MSASAAATVGAPGMKARNRGWSGGMAVGATRSRNTASAASAPMPVRPSAGRGPSGSARGRMSRRPASRSSAQSATSCAAAASPGPGMNMPWGSSVRPPPPGLGVLLRHQVSRRSSRPRSRGGPGTPRCRRPAETPNLLAVRVVADVHLRHRGEHEDAHRLVAGVGHLVRAGRAGREADRVARLQHLLELAVAVGAPQRRPPREHEQPLLRAELEVVRADALARRQVVDAAADALRADERRQPGGLPPGSPAGLPGRSRLDREHVDGFMAPPYGWAGRSRGMTSL